MRRQETNGFVDITLFFLISDLLRRMNVLTGT